jgi:hypothetical protein
MGRPKGSKNTKIRAAKPEEVTASAIGTGYLDAQIAEAVAPAEQPDIKRSRTDERRRERRRRDDGMDGSRLNLKIPPQYANDKENVYRWINDEKARIHSMTQQDDWDKVATDSDDDAKSVCRQVGTKANGDPLFAHLVRKPKEWHDEDRARQQASLDETMDQLADTGKRGDPTKLGNEAGYVATDVVIRDGRRS